ncbi:MAG: patatin family protein [Clostridia bacterium]|nr:patatin family protein [Clostridia bacterium]
MKTALILEGGAMRGMFTCGVLDVLMEKRVPFDGAAGISAGAVFGCNYKSRQIGRAIRYNKKYCRDPRYCGLRSLITTGDLYGADFCYRELPDELDPFDRNTFREDPMAFHVGATNIRTGAVEFHECADGGPEDMLWMRASASMPLVSRPVRIGSGEYLDGGIACAVPYSHMADLGYSKQVIVLTRPRGYRKKKSPLLPVFRPWLREEGLKRAMENRHIMYNSQMDEIDALEGRALVIRPPEDLGVRRVERDPKALERAYRIGREQGAERLSEIRRFLET